MTLSTAGLMLALVLFAGQAPVTPPPLPADQQQRLAKLPADVQVYERFRYWAGFQPPEVQKEALRHLTSTCGPRASRPTIARGS